jgi:hypothetical protein
LTPIDGRGSTGVTPENRLALRHESEGSANGAEYERDNANRRRFPQAGAAKENQLHHRIPEPDFLPTDERQDLAV